MVKKSNDKWRMYVDYIDLNKVCPNDTYALSNIDRLVDNTVGYELFSFLDGYSRYNQIQMYPPDQDKKTFTTEGEDYCYKVMLFGLKNAGLRINAS